MDDRRFVEDLVAALPEAFPDPADALADPLPYGARIGTSSRPTP